MTDDRVNKHRNIVIDEYDGLVCKYWVNTENWVSDTNRYDLDFGVTLYNSYGNHVNVGNTYIDTGHRSRTEDFNKAIAEIDGVIGALKEARAALVDEYNRLLGLAAYAKDKATKEESNNE